MLEIVWAHQLVDSLTKINLELCHKLDQLDHRIWQVDNSRLQLLRMAQTVVELLSVDKGPIQRIIYHKGPRVTKTLLGFLLI